jgi:hypothetical protein
MNFRPKSLQRAYFLVLKFRDQKDKEKKVEQERHRVLQELERR